MPRVLFTISYTVKAEKRDVYLDLIKEIRSHFVEQRGKQYSVYEQKGKKDSFVEVFLCNSLEEYDALEDDQNEATEALVGRLEECLEDGKMKYTTLIEVE
jgi:hypothetical protein